MEYIHQTVNINGIDIDVDIAPLIKKLWNEGVRTYFSCQGGILDPNEYDERTLNPWFYYKKDGNLYEFRSLIIHKDDFEKFKQIANLDFIMSEPGSHGYALEWIKNRPDNNDLLYVYWTPNISKAVNNYILANISDENIIS